MMRFLSDGWLNNVAKGNVLQTFDSWGPEFEIQFDITVDDLSFAYWANVFRFTTRNSNTGCDITTYLDTGTVDSSWGCCTSDNPCNAGEGDCDSDSECIDGLYCGKDNCPSGFPSGLDCCTPNNGEKTLLDFGVSVDGTNDSIRISTEDSYYVTGISKGQSYKIVIKQYFVPGPGSNCNDLCSTGTQWTPDPVFCSGDFYYEVIMDGTQKVYEKNTSPNIFSNVMLYGSCPQYNAFNSNLGQVYLRWVKSTNTEDYCQYTQSGCDIVTYEEAGCSGEERYLKELLRRLCHLNNIMELAGAPN